MNNMLIWCHTVTSVQISIPRWLCCTVAVLALLSVGVAWEESCEAARQARGIPSLGCFLLHSSRNGLASLWILCMRVTWQARGEESIMCAESTETSRGKCPARVWVCVCVTLCLFVSGGLSSLVASFPCPLVVSAVCSVPYLGQICGQDWRDSPAVCRDPLPEIRKLPSQTTS